MTTIEKPLQSSPEKTPAIEFDTSKFDKVTQHLNENIANESLATQSTEATNREVDSAPYAGTKLDFATSAHPAAMALKTRERSDGSGRKSSITMTDRLKNSLFGTPLYSDKVLDKIEEIHQSEVTGIPLAEKSAGEPQVSTSVELSSSNEDDSIATDPETGETQSGIFRLGKKMGEARRVLRSLRADQNTKPKDKSKTSAAPAGQEIPETKQGTEDDLAFGSGAPGSEATEATEATKSYDESDNLAKVRSSLIAPNTYPANNKETQSREVLLSEPAEDAETEEISQPIVGVAAPLVPTRASLFTGNTLSNLGIDTKDRVSHAKNKLSSVAIEKREAARKAAIAAAVGAGTMALAYGIKKVRESLEDQLQQ